MAAQDKVTFKQDLTEPVKIRHYEGVVFTGDDCGNLIKVALFDGGAPYSGGGTVSATAVLADGTTFPLTHGSITGNMVSVPLEAGALVVSGLMGLYVKISGGGIICTVLNAIFTVQVTDTGRVPAATVTTVNELVQEIKDAQDSFPADLTNLLAAVAPTFSTSTAYSAGAYVWQGGKLYRFTTAHPAGTWTGTDAVTVALGNDVADLKSAMYNVFDDTTWQLVKIDTTDGKTWESNNKYLTCLRMPVVAGQILTVAGNETYGSRVRVYFYDTDYDFLNVSDEYVRNTNVSTTVTIPQAGYIRVGFQSYSQNTLTDALQAAYKSMPCLYISTKALNDTIGDLSTTLTSTTATANGAASGVASIQGELETIDGYLLDLLPTCKATATGVSSNGFWNVGNDNWTASDNFGTLTVDYDDTVLDWFYTGNVPNQLTAGATFLNSSGEVISYALEGTSVGNVTYTDRSIGTIPEGTKKIAFTTYTQNKALAVQKKIYGLAYTNKAFVIQGDSIETESAGKWPVMLKNAITFGSYTNCAVGGTCIAAVGSNYISSDARMALMPETADIVLVGGGTNDWGNNVPMGTLDDLSSNTNFAGAVYSLINKLQTKYPSAYIIFMSNQTGCSPNRTGFDDSSGWVNNLGYTMSDYAEMLESVCKFAAIPFIDVNHECGINRLNYTLYNLQETNQNNDTVYVHPNEAGAKRMFRVIYNWFRNNAPTE